MRFGGIDPPRLAANVVLILCPDGRFVCLIPRLIRRCMSALYACKTRELSAFGNGEAESQNMYSTESLTLIRRTFTHSAGAGILAGLYQKNSWQRLNPISSQSASNR